jgi:hypothetical protein
MLHGVIHLEYILELVGKRQAYRLQSVPLAAGQAGILTTKAAPN